MLAVVRCISALEYFSRDDTVLCVRSPFLLTLPYIIYWTY